jgi:hypothetical protein
MRLILAWMGRWRTNCGRIEEPPIHNAYSAVRLEGCGTTDCTKPTRRMHQRFFFVYKKAAST